MKHIKRISLIFFSVLILVACVPIQAFAVDPVSAATMANAFAQAITAYGASQGVSMTFDVTNTDGIGEGVKELWDNFKADMESNQDYSGPTIETFNTMSVSTWATLYKKVGNKLGIDLTAEITSVFDGFWNWLLSGPAEMTKVDNQYYEWTLNQSGNVTPIVVYSITPIPNQPVPIVQSASDLDSNGMQYAIWNNSTSLKIGSDSDDGYAFIYGSTYNHLVFVSSVQNQMFRFGTNYNTKIGARAIDQYSYNGYSIYYGSYNLTGITSVDIPTFETLEDALNFYIDVIGGVITGENLSVRPYVGDTVPQNVYIPDNTDVNYEPVAVEIPLDISWDDSLFGDGTDTLTDAQAEAITNTLSDTIVQSDTKTLELADTANPPVSSGVDTFHSVLPFGDLPSFQFNFSGIWHYVREWVSSLGAWLTTMFTIWNGLPYAIVVPVYASAVIVIVLGVYKRFFM